MQPDATPVKPQEVSSVKAMESQPVETANEESRILNNGPEEIPHEGQPVNITPLPKKKKTILWVILGCCGCAFLAFLASIIVFLMVFAKTLSATGEVTTLISSICNDINTDQSIQKYFTPSALASDAFENNISTVSKQMLGCKTLTNVNNANLINKNNQEIFDVKGKVTFESGTAKNIELQLIKLGGEWEIQYISVE